MKNLFISMIIAQLFAQSVLACTNGRGIVPENSLNIPVNKSRPQGVSLEEYEALMAQISTLYSPVFAGKGAVLVFENNWDDGTVNAYADRDGNKWLIKLYGGMARHHEMTRDAYALVLCHEVGHHIGGMPFRGYPAWAASEGQSDYFATTKCMREMFLNDDNATIVGRMTIPSVVTSECASSWPNKLDRMIFVRSAMAAQALLRAFDDIGNDSNADFSTPDRSVISSTETYYPENQCRLDTYFNGAVCLADKAIEMSWTNEKQGTCHQTTTTRGVRPLCWFKPNHN